MRKQVAVMAFISPYGSASMINSWTSYLSPSLGLPHAMFNLRPFSAHPHGVTSQQLSFEMRWQSGRSKA
jgi:hypothetical protein